jgi:hypothetical protein
MTRTQKYVNAKYHILLTLLTTSIIIIVQPYYPLLLSSSAEAADNNNNNNSPSFVKQEILDAPADWQLWRTSSNMVPITTHDGHTIQVESAKNISECKLGNGEFVSPDLGSVSYISNGKTLNATVWLTSPFKEPPLSDSVDPYQEQFEIKTSNLTSPSLTVEKIAAKTIGEMLNPLITINEQSNSSTVAGNHAYKLVYTAMNSEGLELKNMTFWTIKNSKVYDITYSALQANYSDYLPMIENMINSIQFVRSSDDRSTTNDNKSSAEQYKNNIGVYTSEIKTLGIKIKYPTDWEKKEIVDNNNKENKIVIFYSPFADKLLDTPSWHEITFTMALAIDSIQHHGVTDYRVIYSRSPNTNNNADYGNNSSSSKNNNNTSIWTRKVLEVSAFDKTRILEEEKNYTSFYNIDQPYVTFSFDLSKVNFPQQYRAVFYTTDYFILKHRFCRLIDTTPWAIMPPPDFTISTQPSSSIVLRPGEEKDVELTIKGNTHLSSEAVLTENNNNTSNGGGSGSNNNNNANYVVLSFIPNKVSIPPSSIGTSTLHIKVLDKAKAVSYSLPIVANVSFPTTITNRGGESFSNFKSVSVLPSSSITLTVLPPYTVDQDLHNFVNSWITPISGMWTFLAGVAAVIGPLIIRRRQKKQKEETDNRE